MRTTYSGKCRHTRDACKSEQGVPPAMRTTAAIPSSNTEAPRWTLSEAVTWTKVSLRS